MTHAFLPMALLLAVCFFPFNATAEPPPPNLVVVMTDDQGYADVGFNGCKDIPTPNLDRIAQGGVVFTNAYVTYAVCAPSRAGFITGRYPQRFGFERNPAYLPRHETCGLPPEETTLAEALKTAGYRTGIVGKWHLGAHENFHPSRHGFDYFFGHLGGGHRYFAEELTIKDSQKAEGEHESYRTWIMRDHDPVKTTKYLTDEFSEDAVRFIERNKDRPFFLFLSYNAPHTPLQAPPSYLKRVAHIPDQKRRTYAAMLTAVDDGVGRVLDTLRDNGLEQNTIVVFLSDNGGSGNNGSSNAPLRGKKGSPWEGGFRVPFAVRWPAGLPSGTTFDGTVSSLDIFATMAAINGLKTDAKRPLDGVNLLPYVKGEKKGPPHPTIYLRNINRGAYAIRNGDLKMTIPKSNVAPKLYNLETDLGESQDIAAENTATLQKLQGMLDAWDAQLIDPVFPGLANKEVGKQKNAEPKATK